MLSPAQINSALSSCAGRIADLLWPRICPVETCRAHSDRPGRHICSRCFASLPFFEPAGACRVCGSPVGCTAPHPFVCEACSSDPPAFEAARAPLEYAEPADRLIQDLKYRRATWLVEDFADLLEGCARSVLPAAEMDLVLPVPLHPNRERRRGYNQSALLARALAARLNRKFDRASFIRVRDTPHQARLTAEQRRENLKGAFSAARPDFLRGRTLLVVDDVLTSSSTARECASTLRAAGAARVFFIAIARATPRK